MKHITIFSLVLVLLSSCGGKEKAQDENKTTTSESIVTLTDAQLSNAGIVTGKIEEKEISSILRLNGRIDVPPQNMVSISVPLGGYLRSSKLLPGMHVSKGEAIGVIEDQQYIQLQQDYLTARARMGYLEKEYNRQKELNESQATSDKVFQQAEADYKSQRVLVTSLAQKLQLAGINTDRISETNISRRVNIYSPINGFVTKVNVNIGKYVSPTDELFQLVNPTDIHLALKVFEKDVDKLFIGQKLTAYTNNVPGKKYPCEIFIIGHDLATDGSTEVHCHFASYDKSLIPGTYMNAEVEVKNNKAFVLPEDAVVRYENKQYVFIKKSEKQFEMREVQTGNIETGLVELVNGGSVSREDFVLKGAYSLLMTLKNKSEE